MKTIQYTETKTIRKPQLEISYYEDAESPRAMQCNVGYFITCDNKYNSPDDNELLKTIIENTAQRAGDQIDHMELIEEEVLECLEEKVLEIMPVCKYEHGNVVYRLGTGSGFDCSNNGFYIVTDKTLQNAGLDKTELAGLEDIISAELEEYTQWCNGEIYEYRLLGENGELVDACSGFTDINRIKEFLPEEWQNEEMSEYMTE